MQTFYYLCTLAYLLTITPSYAQHTPLFHFESVTTGEYPNGSLISDGLFLYGMTNQGGANNMGTIFKILPDGSNFEVLLDFEGTTNGAAPQGSLFYDGTYLYGMTENGGINGYGVIFKIMPDGSGYEKLLDFEGISNGGWPFGSLISDGSYLYGMTQNGGVNQLGTIFKIMPDGSGYEKLLDFDGNTNGGDPRGSLVYDGNFLYGMTGPGSTNSNSYGTVFKIMPDGSGYEKLLNFEGATNGSYPQGNLLIEGAYLYGVTGLGGIYNKGTIFKIMPDGSGYEKLLDFDDFLSGDGNHPYCSLISVGTFLYGMTSRGGTNDIGTIFKIMPDGNGYEKLVDFNASDGYNPQRTSLIFDGSFFYGMTFLGGNHNGGVIFKYEPTLGIDETKMHSELTVYPNPTTGIINISTSISGVQSVSVTNTLGEVVLNKEMGLDKKTLTIDISEQPAGVYFLKLGNFIERIIRQ